MDLSVIIVSHSTNVLTSDCIISVIKNTKGIKYEIIVIDNASNDGSITMLKRYKSKIANFSLILKKKNFGFGKANNQGMKNAKGRYLLLLNSDTKINSNVLGEMISWMDKNSDIGISSCALLNISGSYQGTGGYFPTLPRVFSWMILQDIPFMDKIIKPFHPMKEKSGFKNEKFYRIEKELDWLTGAFLLIKREVYEEVGGFDEDYFMYTEETDLCYRAKMAQWKIYYNPKWSIVHLGGARGTKELAVLKEFEGVKLFYKKHFPLWQYPILRLIIKLGSLGRAILFGLLEGRDSAKIY